ncbi:hypothetical protein BST36_04705 [Mycolicibacterium moriokaense]|uniref:DUF2834 domain-containing protein n=1 Tax=Mycolicibacterium moriokaense TaxID=39691 RepID=A0AAD1HDZ2_9MYCO|nr:DUF2834 domain-containing protein [Mycolicibacterium moriokaense]MCV7038039.1 DUF2834 domain-containing protein [Mycolicibacterium moriokaense]ORB25904.1 hypothetical protein BST36_04705 [Mycolicibacterium moriokaense]BBX03131.1 hypothetical protein MMOR_40670 [Mycolicibacterium moriokaense]
MTTETQAASLPTSSKALIAVYALTAVGALIATWSQNLAYMGSENFLAFGNDLKVTPASRSIAVDLFMLGIPLAILMVAEARKHGVKFVWLYLIGSAVTAISVTFPLFLIARELRIAKTDATQLHAGDAIGLGILAVVMAAIVIWVDLG